MDPIQWLESWRGSQVAAVASALPRVALVPQAIAEMAAPVSSADPGSLRY